MKLLNRLRATEGSRLGNRGAGHAALIQPPGAAGEILRSAPWLIDSAGAVRRLPQESQSRLRFGNV
ncbi:MAG TPA: hypothetical protein VFY65_13555, partial [Longimicrobium sp.]|nr:hypothetical protein [Longimicrobium sp.]